MDVRSPHPSLPAQPRAFDFFVDGAWVRTGERKTLDRLSPGHDIPVTTIALCTRADVDHAVSVARQAFEDRRWSGQSSAERAAILLKAAQGIRARAEELALLETLETGKPISQSRGEVEGAASIYEYAAGAARMLHGDTFNNLGDSILGLVTREPIGVVGLITPWNFPFFILCRTCAVHSGRRLHDRLQAFRIHLCHDAHHGGHPVRGRTARRRVQRRHRARRRGRTGDHRASRHRHGVLHRLDGDRPADAAGFGRQLQEARPGARRQEPADRLCRRRSRGRRRRGRIRHVLQRRPVLRRRQPAHCRTLDRRDIRKARRRKAGQGARRRSARSARPNSARSSRRSTTTRSSATSRRAARLVRG